MRRSVPLLIVLLLPACGRIGYDELWAGLFLVTTTEDRLAGPPTLASPDDLTGGATGLSLREAVVIAGNRAGDDVIRFDPDRFPRWAPAEISLQSDLPDLARAGTTIDGSGAGVLVSATVPDGVFHVTADRVEIRSLFLGGRDGPQIRVDLASGVRVEDNQFEGGAHAVEATGTTGLVVAGNRIAGSTAEAILVDGGTGATIAGNRIERAAGDPVGIHDATDALVDANFVIVGDKTAGRGVHLERVSRSVIKDKARRFSGSNSATALNMVRPTSAEAAAPAARWSNARSARARSNMANRIRLWRRYKPSRIPTCEAETSPPAPSATNATPTAEIAAAIQKRRDGYSVPRRSPSTAVKIGIAPRSRPIVEAVLRLSAKTNES